MKRMPTRSFAETVFAFKRLQPSGTNLSMLQKTEHKKSVALESKTA
jgi:hypothetical protein